MRVIATDTPLIAHFEVKTGDTWTRGPSFRIPSGETRELPPLARGKNRLIIEEPTV